MLFGILAVAFLIFCVFHRVFSLSNMLAASCRATTRRIEGKNQPYVFIDGVPTKDDDINWTALAAKQKMVRGLLMHHIDYLKRLEMIRRIETVGTIYPKLDPELQVRIMLADAYHPRDKSYDGYFVDLDV